MNDQDFQRRVRACFGELLDQAAEARAASLEALLQKDPEVGAEVGSLLRAHASAGAFLRAPGSRLAERLERASRERVPSPAPPEIEGFRVERLLGSGSFGEVWLASQLEPFEREVAVKVVACANMGSAGLARFTHEVRVLARMEHPAIARVFGAGVTSDRRPWFSMEVVRGAPLTVWCDEHRFTLVQRIELFEHVCRAVHHAHQLGILHRDLKPSNVLVTQVDGQSAPKVIDFGLSRFESEEPGALEPQRSLSLGTPLYMAPEQADASALADTRSDVYGLGALLCELVAGEPPLELGGEYGSLDRILDSVRTSPRRSLERILTSPEADVAALAALRGTGSPALLRAARGELGSIVGRATAFDPLERYDTVLELARDLRAYLGHRPVRAHGAGLRYHARCLLRRRAPLALAVTAVLLAALLGGALALREHFRSLRSDAAARESAFATEEVNRLLERWILAPHPDRYGRDVTMLEILRAAEAELAEDPPDRPLTEARVRHALGSALLGLGDAKQAELELRRAVDLMEQLPTQPGNDLAAGYRQLGQALIRLGRPAEARETIARGLARLAESETSDEVEVGLRLALGMALYELGESASAVEQWERVASDGASALGARRIDVLLARFQLAQHRVQSEAPSTIAPKLENLLADFVDEFGDAHPKTQSCRSLLGILLEREGRVAEAEALFREVLAGRIDRLGAAHPTTLETSSSLASVLHAQGRREEALELLRSSLTAQLEHFDPDHPSVLKSRSSIASLLAESGRGAEAVEEFRELYEVQRAIAGDFHPDTLGYLTNLANCLELLQRSEEARPLHRRAYEGKLEVLGPEHPQTLSSLANLASSLRIAGELDEARVLVERLIEIRERLLGPGHPLSTTARKHLGLLLYAERRPVDGANEFVRAYRASREQMGAVHGQTVELLVLARRLLADTGRPDDGEALQREHDEAVSATSE